MNLFFALAQSEIPRPSGSPVGGTAFTGGNIEAFVVTAVTLAAVGLTLLVVGYLFKLAWGARGSRA